MQVCNSCRYCEGYCAVFPAMELLRSFTNPDLSYLANLCHNCRGCFYACPYAPPHEFALNLPKTFAQVRNESYAEYAWPRVLAGVFASNGVVVSLVTVACLTLIFMISIYFQGPNALYAKHLGSGAFYAVIPFRVMVTVSIVTLGYALLALAMGFLNFWKDIGGTIPELFSLSNWQRTFADVLTLRNLGGGGHGCTDKDETFSNARRRFHHALFYGFLLCAASTTVAAIYDHFLHWIAPYPFVSLPVLLGTMGGVGMMVGCSGLTWLKLVGDQTPADRNLLGADLALTLLLALSAFSGLVLLALRSTEALGILLALHLSFILALFLVLPYSKFVHGIYRSGALLRNSIERRLGSAPSSE
ncbi:MAG TPA: tricarballylate utilization 4Fe-4S protein TcuB [Candidatus Dormibacteraeota bacterium]|nr:tricarballylate utilization 4Fe-4S protein TcuB [Candidatus Dormibacteraeota bacterium]